MPKHYEWETYAKWAKQYGEIFYLDVLGTPIIFLNSRRLVYECFERRSSIYSDRTTFPMVVDLMEFGWVMTFQRYGDWWRRHRRVMHEKFHPAATEVYKPIQIKHTRDILRRFLTTPENFLKHIQHSAAAIIMEITYGIQVKPENDPYIHRAEKALKAGSEAAVPGRFIVDVIPLLKYIPEWFPGASFRKQAKIWNQYGVNMRDLPFEHVKSTMVSRGTVEPSFASDHLEALAAKQDAPSDAEEVIKNTAAVVYAGGADTTSNTLKTFMLIMVLFPDAQKKAQAELDSLLGGTRLVEFEDKASLPYTVALYKEVMRWHPLVPMGVAHAVTEDDVVDGYFIPKGAIVFGTTWTLFQEESDFGPNPDIFDPDRLLKLGRRDPMHTGVFGYGRRICPGRYMGENSVFLAVASILQCFDISGPRDESGTEMKPEYKCASSAQ
ncbi:hypothetical protein M422DRAFT_236437 [Sphaerobolus stellatus SS14]|uniref:Cytochrome P450 n=1 Tax=Sphaerobolus stellatus (strain SS14) TaxID=990650 RepID=A0A0C9TXT2_SPHS4|nr:hypothetical protein M422DRAFT_236437 [Sphaerobolus stellatus SS14]